MLSPSFSVLGLQYSHLNVESVFTVRGVCLTPSRLLLGFKTGKRNRVQLFFFKSICRPVTISFFALMYKNLRLQFAYIVCLVAFV